MRRTHSPVTSGVSRRTLLRSAAAGAAGALLTGIETPALASDVLPEFPDGISVSRRTFENWDGVVTTEPLWTATPHNADDVVKIVNWAVEQGYTVRPTGFRHTWSPLTVMPREDSDTRTVLVDTTTHLTSMSIPQEHRVTVGAGTRMDTLLEYLHENGAALASAPAPGDVSVGGVLAVNGHGTAVHAAGEKRADGQVMGTMSNLVTEFTAVVWDEETGAYTARTFDRSHPDAKAFLTGIGRVFLLEVTLQTMDDYSLRCECVTHIPQQVLFAEPSKAGPNSLSSLLDRHGRVGLIWYTYTTFPWVQKWTVSPRKPLLSRKTRGPYNFPFADNLPDSATRLVSNIVSGAIHLAPTFGATVESITAAGLTASGARDMWGPAKDFLHFVKPTTLRVSAGSHAVVTRRADVQRVVHEFSTWFTSAQTRYRKRGKYPVNSCVEIRVTGVDTPAEVDVPGAEAPALSAARPVDGRPELDTVVWLDALTLPGTPDEYDFFAEMEEFIRSHYADYCVTRPEWAKRWATTTYGSWTDKHVMGEVIPAVFPEWEWARSTFDRYDPHRLFTNDLLDRIMPAV